MPGGDRSGPNGLGPMTGRAAGYCADYAVPGYVNPVGCRMGLSRGRGLGRGCGFGRGAGRGFGFRADVYPYAPELSPQQEADMLKDQAKAMQDELKAINERISELAAVAKKGK